MKRFEVKTTTIPGVQPSIFALVDNRDKQFAPFSMEESAANALEKVRVCPRQIKTYALISFEGYKFEDLKPSEAQQ